MNKKVLIEFALKSFWFRKKLMLPVIFLISLNFVMSLSFERLRVSLSQSFTGVVSGVDLIVGAPTSPLNLVLYTLFNMGSASNNVSIESYKKISSLESVEWSIPISLGDSHRGYRVVGTKPIFFEKYQYRNYDNIKFYSGMSFHNPFEVVVGSEVAKNLDYQLGEKLILSHGSLGKGYDGFTDHGENPFVLVGILKQTGTPIDQSVYISIRDMDYLHEISETESVSAFFLKLKSKIETLRLQREINTNLESPLLAVIPTVALSELWSALDFFEDIFIFLGIFIVLISGLALLFIFYFVFEARKSEVHLLKVMGVTDFNVGLFFSVELLIVLFVSLSLSLLIDVYVFQSLSQMLLSSFGIWVSDVATWKSLIWPLTGVSLFAFVINFVMTQLSLKKMWKIDE